MPTGNDFIKDTAQQYKLPEGNPGESFPFVQNDFDDSGWEQVELSHDWAIKGPFIAENIPGIASMGRLPSFGVAWYRRKLEIPASDQDRNIYLDVEGAMSYAKVWINGHLAGGWPYGYNFFCTDLTPYVSFGAT